MLESKEKETIILLHGMGRTRASMWVLGKRFRNSDFEVLNFAYNERLSTLKEISDQLQSFIKENVKTSDYHLIGHSLGNVIARNGFKKTYPEGLKRIVMLAPPNHPASLAILLKDNLIYKFLMGDAGQKLSDEEFYESLPIPKVEFGVIAGHKGQSLTFEEPNDGVVSVEGTKLEGMKDFILVDHTHTFLMNAQDTFEYCRNFLILGKFESSSKTGF